MDKWVLRADFERDYRAHGLVEWRCGDGHPNAVLPGQAEVDEMNRNLLAHPEFYTASCSYDSQALRRYRLCPACVASGALVLAVHDGACKQWPGGGAGASTHAHCFCFKCCGAWGIECGHGRVCPDPGVQQVDLF